MKFPNDKKRPNPSTPTLGRTYQERSKMVHVSKKFFLNPLAVEAEYQNKPFAGARYLPLPGDTYNVGRNAMKRARRAARGRR